MLIALHRLLTGQRRSLLLVGTVLILGFSVFSAHGGLGQDHMGMGSGHSSSMCLAVLEIVGALALAALPKRRDNRSRVRRFSVPPFVRSQSSPCPPPPAQAARASPLVLQVIRR